MARNDTALTETSYLILVSLNTPRHGYGIMQQVQAISDGRVSLGPGTLYGALKSMLKEQWIREVPGDDPRRRLYRLTITGERIVQQEILRLNQLARIGNQFMETGGKDNEEL